MSNRADATRDLLYFIDRFAPGSPNRKIYEDYLGGLTDAQFGLMIDKMERDEEVLALYVPINAGYAISLERNFEIAEELGYKLKQRLKLTDPGTGQVYITPIEHLIIDMPLRRQVQTLEKKMSVPETNEVVDERSGQPTGISKGSSLSYPELQVNAAKGLNRMLSELAKYRAGDPKAYNAMNRQILETGSASLDSLANIPTRVTATENLSKYFTGMMIADNLRE